MTPEETMAARMYPAAPDVSAPATPSPPPGAAAEPSTTADEQATSVQALDGPSEAERAAQMADAAAMVPESPDAYTQALASGGFEQLQSQARYDGDHESVAAFKEGQQVAGELRRFGRSSKVCSSIRSRESAAAASRASIPNSKESSIFTCYWNHHVTASSASFVLVKARRNRRTGCQTMW